MDATIEIGNPLDVHYTPAWAVRALIPHLPLTAARGLVIDAGAGSGVIAATLAAAGLRVLAVECRADEVERGRRDRPEVEWLGADYLSPDLILPPAVGVVMNPPYGGRMDTAAQFVRRSLDHVRSQGGFVAALLRLNWLAGGQVRHGRGDWLRSDMPTEILTLDRRPSFATSGATDSTDYAWMLWGPVASATSRFSLLRCRGSVGEEVTHVLRDRPSQALWPEVESEGASGPPG